MTAPNTTQLIESWQAISPENLAAQPPKPLGDALTLTKRAAQDSLARERQNQLDLIARKAADPQQKWVLRIFATAVGMLTMSAGAQILTARLGNIGLPAAMGLAGGLTFMGDGRMTRAHTNRRRKDLTLEALAVAREMPHDNPPSNQFGEANFQTRVETLMKVEGDPQQKTFPVNAVLGTVLNGAEYAVNLWIVSQLGLPGGLLLEALVSVIPIGIQYAAAITESETYDLPQKTADLQKASDAYRWDWNSLSSEDQEAEEYRIHKLDLNLTFLPHGDPSGECKNLAMAIAIAKFDHLYFGHKKKCLETEGVNRVVALEQQYRVLIKRLEETFPAPVGLTKEEEALKRQQWLASETPKLEREFHADLENLKAQYGIQIEHCQQNLIAADCQFREAHTRWQQAYDNGC